MFLYEKNLSTFLFAIIIDYINLVSIKLAEDIFAPMKRKLILYSKVFFNRFFCMVITFNIYLNLMKNK